MSKHLLETYPPFAAKLVSGKGPYIYDDQGKEYLDFLSGIAVVSLGHSNEEIALAISNQANTLSHVSNFFENEFTEKVSSSIDGKISSTLKEKGGSGGRVFFGNSGAEANECALKIAKRYGKSHKGNQGDRTKIVTANNSFHGRTLATLAATGQPKKHKNFEPLPDFFKYFEFGNINSLKEVVDENCVAVMIEVIQGETGVNIADASFYSELDAFCKKNDLLLIIDEIQTGMCRTGKWFGFEHFGLQPDIVTMAKALGNGMPIGACWSSEHVASVMEVGDHGSTFGGQPLALSAANAVLEIMERDLMAQKAQQLGNELQNQLEDSGLFSSVRGLGLLIGADMDDSISYSAPEMVKRCRDNGLIINATGDRTLRILPPLIIDSSHISQAVDIIKKSVE